MRTHFIAADFCKKGNDLERENKILTATNELFELENKNLKGDLSAAVDSLQARYSVQVLGHRETRQENVILR